MVQDLLCKELSTVGIVCGDCFSKDGVEWFEERAIEVEVAECGSEDKLHAFDWVSDESSLVEIQREEARGLQRLLECTFGNHGANGE